MSMPETAIPEAPTEAEPIITAYQVERAFQPGVGVFDLSFEVPAGTIFGLIGPSGCGKTTTVRLLTGLYKPDHGVLRVLGHRPHQWKAATRERVGYMPQKFVLHDNLTVWENLMFAASLYGMPYIRRRRRLNEVLGFVELTTARHRLSRHLSGGMQRRLGLACALVHGPDLIFADEPTAGIDPILRGKFWQHFHRLRDHGYTLFVTTQYIGEVAYCDTIGVMRAGHLLYLDTPAGLRRRALGGEIIKIVVDEDQRDETVRILRDPDNELVSGVVSRVTSMEGEPGVLHIHVEEASVIMPYLVHLFAYYYPDIVIRQIEEHYPPFDDIFITLLKDSEASSHE